MKKSIEKRVKELEDLLNVKRGERRHGIAKVIYNPKICPQSNLPPIDADVILCLPDNGRRTIEESNLPSEEFLIKSS